MGRLNPLLPLAVLTIAAYGVFFSFHNLVHQTDVRPLTWSTFGETIAEAVREWLKPPANVDGPVEDKTFNWDKAISSKKLVWNSCYPDAAVAMECARLSVPLNYSDPTGEQASIALTRIPSPAPHAPDYRGPVLLNPGGPGGSGVDMVLRTGPAISHLLGAQFDIVGFDPRGVGRSQPAASFFDGHLERLLWQSSEAGNPGALYVVNSTSDGLARKWARSNVAGQLAAKKADVLRHINTDHTARDMLSIVEAHGQEKLQYWGFSYGSVLGSTFAAMFPDKVGRIVIDGVVDMENYYEGLWSTNLRDADKTMESFYTFCFKAGKAQCAFWASSPEEIKANLYRLYAAVKERPIPINLFDPVTGEASNYGLIDYNLVRLGVFAALYKPWIMFPAVAEALSDLQDAVNLMHANASSTDAFSAEANEAGQKLFKLFHIAPTKCGDACGCGGGEKTYPFLPDAELAIACNDGGAVPNTLKHFEEYFDDLAGKSEWGELWAGIRAGCIGWPDLPKDHFRGPLKANTSHPLLIIGNTADPVTPLWAAKKTSKGFPGSVVLTQDSPGHCSLSAPSFCTALHVRQYFIFGILPRPNTVCQVFGTPFEPRGFPELQDGNRADPTEAWMQHNYGDDRTRKAKSFVNNIWDLNEQFYGGFPL